MNLCKYKNIFGEPNKGVHSYKILNIAIVDLTLTLLGSIIIAYFLKLSWLMVFFFLLVLSVLIHKLFCVETTLTKFFFK